MMKMIKFATILVTALVAIIGLIALFFLVNGRRGSHEFYGRTVDAAGNPLANVEVTFNRTVELTNSFDFNGRGKWTPQGGKVLSKSDGTFLVDAIERDVTFNYMTLGSLSWDYAKSREYYFDAGVAAKYNAPLHVSDLNRPEVFVLR